ncbi:MAG: TonB-dependent receptor plug domain-containing protein, partial [Myxococcota bacterium]
LPEPGNDALKSLQSLPGVSRVPLGLGGLVLRGSSPRDSNVYLDGIEVPLLYHFGGLASFYPSAMLDSLEMIPGSFGARYGRAQGGIVTLRSRRGRTDRWRVASEVSLIDASVRADGPGPLGGSWSLGLRRSYVDAVLTAALPSDSDLSLTLAPRYYDGQLRYDLDLGSGDRLAVMLFGSDDRLRFALAPDTPTDDQNNLSYVSRFARAAIRLSRRDGDFDMSVTPWIGTDESSLRFDDAGITRESIPMGARADITRNFARGYVSGGLDVQGGRFRFDVNNEPPPAPGPDSGGVQSTEGEVQRTGVVWSTDVAMWLEGLVRVADDAFSIKPGLRLERYGLTDEWVLDPRINLSQKVSRNIELTQAIGLYHQPPVFADLDPVFGNQDLQSSYSVQGSVGARVELPIGAEVAVTGFYEEMYDLPTDVVTSASAASADQSPRSGGIGAISREITSEQFGTYSYQENVGRGRAYGIETLVRGSRGQPGQTGHLLGWVSYTLSRSLRRDDPTRYMDYRPYVLDQTHVLTALGSIAVTDNWQLGARLRYVTGNPYTPVAGTYFDTDIQEYRSLAGEVLSERLPAFFQLDLRLDRRWRQSWGTVSLYLDVQNVTNRVNPEGLSYNYDYTEIDYTRGLPIFPSIGLEYRP